MKRIYLFRTWMQKVLAALFFGQVVLDSLLFDSLDLDDVFKQDYMGCRGEDTTAFRTCFTIDEYNSEVMRISHAHRRYFVFDLSNRDGHFRI